MKLSDEFLERFASSAIRRGDADAWYSEVASPLGRLVVVQTERGVCRIAFENEDERELLDRISSMIGVRVVASRSATERVRDELASYLKGESRGFDVPVDLALVRTEFGKNVLATATGIPRGTTATYAEVAARSGRPRAMRAAGTALGRNPVPIVVPCHRVVATGGGLGGYTGGLDIKRFLLRLEGALEAPGGGSVR